MRDIIIYATDTMADWEFAYLTTEVARAEQARPGRFRVRFAGDGTATVRTLDGLPVTPEIDLGEIDPATTAAFVLPGGDTYADGHLPVLGTVDRLVAECVPIGAICGATFALARHGLLDSIAHTSNAPSFLLESGYDGGRHYRHVDAVTDGGITTATGLRRIPFTTEILRAAEVFPDSYIDAWLELNSSASEESFHAYMEQAEAFAGSA